MGEGEKIPLYLWVLYEIRGSGDQNDNFTNSLDEVESILKKVEFLR
jgi:hypothetical protein